MPAIPIVLFLGAWQVASDIGAVNPALFSSPRGVAQALLQLMGGEGIPPLVMHIGVTLRRLGLAIVLGVSLGGVAACAMAFVWPVRWLLEPLITFCLPIPGIALTPLFLVWVGYGDLCVVLVGAVAAFFPLAQNGMQGFLNVDEQLVRAASIMGVDRRGQLLHVRLPCAAPYFFLGFKLALVRCWRTVVAVELIAASSWGLGYLIWDAAEYLQMGVVYGGVLLLILVFLFIEKIVIRSLERVSVDKWGMVQR